MTRIIALLCFTPGERAFLRMPTDAPVCLRKASLHFELDRYPKN